VPHWANSVQMVDGRRTGCSRFVCGASCRSTAQHACCEDAPGMVSTPTQSSRFRVAVDIDGVLADTVGLFARRLRAAHGLGVSREQLDTYRLADNPRLPPVVADAVIEWFRSGGAANAQPLPGAVAGALWLTDRFQLTYWTSRPESLRAVTVRWLRNHGFPQGPLEIAPDRAKILIAADFDLCVDDDQSVAEHFAATQRVGILLANPWIDLPSAARLKCLVVWWPSRGPARRFWSR
jgi:uncharacterized HAD superfamily protein